MKKYRSKTMFSICFFLIVVSVNNLFCQIDNSAEIQITNTINLLQGNWKMVGFEDVTFNETSHFEVSDKEFPTTLDLNFDQKELVIYRQRSYFRPDTINYSFNLEIRSFNQFEIIIEPLLQSKRSKRKKIYSEIPSMKLIKVDNSKLTITLSSYHRDEPFLGFRTTIYYFKKKQNDCRKVEEKFFGDWYFDKYINDLHEETNIKLSKKKVSVLNDKIEYYQGLSFYSSYDSDNLLSRIDKKVGAFQSGAYIDEYWNIYPEFNLLELYFSKKKKYYNYQFVSGNLLLTQIDSSSIDLFKLSNRVFVEEDFKGNWFVDKYINDVFKTDTLILSKAKTEVTNGEKNYLIGLFLHSDFENSGFRKKYACLNCDIRIEEICFTYSNNWKIYPKTNLIEFTDFDYQHQYKYYFIEEKLMLVKQ